MRGRRLSLVWLSTRLSEVKEVNEAEDVGGVECALTHTQTSEDTPVTRSYRRFETVCVCVCVCVCVSQTHFSYPFGLKQ